MSTISAPIALDQPSTPVETMDTSLAPAATTITETTTTRAIPRPIYHYRYLGNYPKDRNTGWSVNMQGVTHDEDNWYFTQTDKLWKFPVGHDLNQEVHGADPARGILQVSMPAVMRNLGYNHFGDFDCAIHQLPYQPKKRFLMIATEGEKNDHKIDPAIAVFRGEDLSFIGHFTIPNQTQFPWCAYNPANKLLYAYLTDEGRLRAYRPDFIKLFQGEVGFSLVTSYVLKDIRGNRLDFPHPQGGCFTPDGQVFFAMNGYYKDTDRDACGIHVFDTNFRRMAHSTNGYGTFNYEFHPGWSAYEEPEGLTYWDRNDGRSPQIRGCLHAIMNDQNWPSDDTFYFKHYEKDESL